MLRLLANVALVLQLAVWGLAIAFWGWIGLGLLQVLEAFYR